MTYDASDPDQVRKREIAARQRARENRALLVAVMEQRQGRNFVYDLLAQCRVSTTSFDRSALNMAFLEGQRNIGLYLTDLLIGACPAMYIKMLEEANERSSSPDTDTDTDS